MAAAGIAKLGAFAALGSSALWAYGSVRYARESRVIGSAGVNLVRALVVLPLFAIVALATAPSGQFGAPINFKQGAWLFVSVICSYAFADNVFYGAARAIGISTALAIASSYPLWSTLVGVLFAGERYGVLRGLGTLLCVGGVIALIRLAPRVPTKKEDGGSHDTTRGILLAFATSVLWAGNTISVRAGSAHLPASVSNTAYVNLVRFLFALPLIAVGHRLFPGRDRIFAEGARSFRRLIVPSVLEACIGSSLFVFALANTDLSIGATLSSMAPLISVPVAIVLGRNDEHGERWNAARFFAVAATVAGVALLVIGA